MKRFILALLSTLAVSLWSADREGGESDPEEYVEEIRAWKDVMRTRR